MIWHWQQYLTIGMGSISFVLFLVAGMINERQQGNSALQMVLILTGQFILYSGGWYTGMVQP